LEEPASLSGVLLGDQGHEEGGGLGWLKTAEETQEPFDPLGMSRNLEGMAMYTEAGAELADREAWPVLPAAREALEETGDLLARGVVPSPENAEPGEEPPPGGFKVSPVEREEVRPAGLTTIREGPKLARLSRHRGERTI